MMLRQGGGHHVEIESKHPPNRDRAQRGGKVAPAPRGNRKSDGNRAASPTCDGQFAVTAKDVKLQSAAAGFNVYRTQVALRLGADPGDGRRASRRLRPQPRVVDQYGLSVTGQGGQQFSLG